MTLMVELSGTVIEHERGYRAQHQSVMECQFSPCPYCTRKVEHVLVAGGRMTTAVCGGHLPAAPEPGVTVVGMADVAALLPVPIVCKGRDDQ